MHRDKKMLLAADIDSNMFRLIKEWRPHIEGFHPEFTPHLQALIEVEQRDLSFFVPLSLPRYKKINTAKERVRYTGFRRPIEDEFSIIVYVQQKDTQLNIQPYELATKALKAIYPGRYEHQVDNQKNPHLWSRILFQQIDSSPVWEPFHGTGRYDRPWLVLWDPEHLVIAPGKCKCCGQHTGEWQKVKTPERIILVCWGTGKNFVGGGYFLGRTVYEISSEPCIV